MLVPFNPSNSADVYFLLSVASVLLMASEVTDEFYVGSDIVTVWTVRGGYRISKRGGGRVSGLRRFFPLYEVWGSPKRTPPPGSAPG